MEHTLQTRCVCSLSDRGEHDKGPEGAAVGIIGEIGCGEGGCAGVDNAIANCFDASNVEAGKFLGVVLDIQGYCLVDFGESHGAVGRGVDEPVGGEMVRGDDAKRRAFEGPPSCHGP